MTTEEVLLDLEKNLRQLIKKNPKIKHFAWDSFIDHKNRYKKDLQAVSDNLKSGKVLDLGASPFHLTYALSNLGYDVTGLDFNPEPFNKFIKQNKLRITKCNIESEKLPFKNKSFDLILFSEVFEHLRINPIFTLKEIYRVLKPKGRLILTTPNLYALHKILMFISGKSFNDAYHEFNQYYIYGYVGHVREYSTNEVKRFLEKNDFKVKKVNYQSYYSFFKYEGIKNNLLLRLAGLIMDILMWINPVWRRHQVFIAEKKIRE